MYPQLKGSLPENLKHLKDSMDGLDWKVSTGTLPPCLKQPWDEGREQRSRSQEAGGGFPALKKLPPWENA